MGRNWVKNEETAITDTTINISPNIGKIGKHGKVVINAGDLVSSMNQMREHGEAKGANVKLSASVGLMPLQNLNLMGLQERPDQWARTAIIASPEQVQALIGLNNQLENPYQVKGAYLI